MEHIDINLLPVGQGAMNLIEIYDNMDRLIHLTLIDCGHDRSRPVSYDSLPRITAKCVDYVAEKMQQRFIQGGEFYLDYVLITHRDSDHWTLFDNLLERLFGTKEVTHTSENILYLQKDLSDDITEDYFENRRQNLYTYSRTYTFPAGEEEITIEYQYTTDLNVQERPRSNVYFQDNLRRVAAVFTLNDFNNPTTPDSCKFYDLKSRECVLNVSLLRWALNPNMVCITGILGTAEYEWDKKYQIPEQLKAKWDIWILFLKDLVPSLDKFREILRLEAILEEGFSEDGFLHYTVDDIIATLDTHQPLENIARQFLWGGYVPADQSTHGNKTGVGKLRARSDLLGRFDALEVSSGQSFGLIEPFHLNIQERLSPEQLHENSVWNSEPTNSPAILRNGTSAVSLLLNTGNDEFQKFLFTGDATVHTFYALYQSKALANSQNSIWTAPHHGSYTTSKGSLYDEELDVDTDIFPFFLEEGNPGAIVMEAGYENRHGHPNYTFCDWAFEGLGYTESACDPHYIYYNKNDTRNAAWTYEEIDVPLYSGVSSFDGAHAVGLIHNFTLFPATEYIHNEIIWDSLARTLPHAKESACPKAIPSPHLFFRRT